MNLGSGMKLSQILIEQGDLLFQDGFKQIREDLKEQSALADSGGAPLLNTLTALATIAAFGNPQAKIETYTFVRQLAEDRGIYPASIEELYRSFGRAEAGNITVPAMNMRAIAFESARGVFRALVENDVGAAIFELSRGEIGFTGQRPMEYTTVILCAAIAEGFSGPLFLQGDHFQVSASRYKENPKQEMEAVKSLIHEAIEVGFYNIDIDTSTLVDLSHAAIADQQELNVSLTAELANFVRAIEPNGITVSLGGEIGEVGEENSTVEEVEVYLSGVAGLMKDDAPTISKLSIQSGTRHGGNVLFDGSFGDMDVDFDLIRDLTGACRETHGVGGCVQHGASMLSLEKISKLPTAGCIEVHLAAAFLNVAYDYLPGDLVCRCDQWLKDTRSNEWKADWSQAQFLHHARRYPIGPFKKYWWQAVECHEEILNGVYVKAKAYCAALNVFNTRDLIDDVIKHPVPVWVAPALSMTAGQGGRDEALIHDLAD